MKKYLFLLVTSLSFLAAMDPPEGEDPPHAQLQEYVLQEGDQVGVDADGFTYIAIPLSEAQLSGGQLSQEQQKDIQEQFKQIEEQAIKKQHEATRILDGILATSELYLCAKEKLTYLKTYQEHKQLTAYFTALISGIASARTKNMRQINELIEDPECRAMLLQARAHAPFENGQLKNEGSNELNPQTILFSLATIEVLEVLRKFDHPLARKLLTGFDALRQVRQVRDKEDAIQQKYSQAAVTKCAKDFLEWNNIFNSHSIGEVLGKTSQLNAAIQRYENLWPTYIEHYNQQVTLIPDDDIQEDYLARIGVILLNQSFLNGKTGTKDWILELANLSKGEVSQRVQEAERKRLGEFLPQSARAFEDKKNARKKKTPKKKSKRRKNTRKKKTRPAHTSAQKPSVVPALQKPAPVRTIDPLETLKTHLTAHFPGNKILEFGPNVVRIKDIGTKRIFTLYNANGDTDHLNGSRLCDRANHPKIHWRVARWHGRDLECVIKQVKKETGVSITDKKDRTRKHQIPAKLLFYFRNMGFDRTFTDKHKNRINCKYLAGHLQDGNYSQAGYFGLGILPDVTEPTIYHACFEPRGSFENVLQSKDLTKKQKANLSLALTLKQQHDSNE